MSVNTYYVWKRKYAGLQTDDLRQLRELERENAQLKRLLAERDLESDSVRAPVPKKRACAPDPVPGARFLMERGVAVRRACPIVGVSTANPYRGPSPARNAELAEALREVWRPNTGHRTGSALLRDRFAPLNLKRVHRLWKESKMSRRRFCKRRTGDPLPQRATRPS